MKIEQKSWTQAAGWTAASPENVADSAQLVLVFGATAVLRNEPLVDAVRKFYPAAHILGCTTAGEICGTRVLDDALVTTAIRFDYTQIRSAAVSLNEYADSVEAGKQLAQRLPQALGVEDTADDQKLTHVLVLSDGLGVNGSDLVRGIQSALPTGVAVTGGLAGDGARFGETLVFKDRVPEKSAIAAIGLYGNRVKIGFGSLAGWDPFGPERRVTRSRGNILFELDGRPALALYKQYLGEEQVKGLPATGLLFPLSMRTTQNSAPLVRTILSVDEQEQSLVFAGDIPEGAHVRLSRANFDRLIDGAVGAAEASRGAAAPELAILISCIGRKLVLKQRIEEEVEGVRDVLGEGAVLSGFYSYGEIAPFVPGERSELHNQTMTITTITEARA
jgi:hypothetical protein